MAADRESAEADLSQCWSHMIRLQMVNAARLHVLDPADAIRQETPLDTTASGCRTVLETSSPDSRQDEQHPTEAQLTPPSHNV